MKLNADSRVSLPSDPSGNIVVLLTVESVVSIVVLVAVDPDSVVTLVVSSVVKFEVDGIPVFWIIQSSKCETEVKQCGCPDSHVLPVT